MTEIVPATEYLFARMQGGLPRRTSRALVAVKDGDPIGLIGLIPDGDALMVYANLTDEIRKDRKALVRLSRAFETLAGDFTVIATASLSVEASGRFLEHFGFKRLHDNVYERRVA